MSVLSSLVFAANDNSDMCTTLSSNATGTVNDSVKPFEILNSEFKFTEGKITLSYDAFSEADLFTILAGSTELGSTECVSGTGSNLVEFSSNESIVIQTKAFCNPSPSEIFSNSSSSWNFEVKICPKKTVSTAEYNALVDLYDTTGGDSWSNRSGWKENKDVCNWYGVTCDDAGNVTELNLSNNNLIDSLPNSIGNLSRLINLNLSYNGKLGGALPSSIGSLKNLTLLDISNGNFSSIPSEIKGMANLNRFDATNNIITTLPSGFAEFVALMTKSSGSIYLTYNKICYATLESNILKAFENYPYSWGKEDQKCETIISSEKEALIALFNATNGASGSTSWQNSYGWATSDNICEWYGVICKGGSVTGLNLASNGLSGKLPNEIGGLKNLEFLSLESNSGLSGAIPDSITSLTKLAMGGGYLYVLGTDLCVNSVQVSAFVENKTGGSKLPNCTERAALLTAQYESLMAFFKATGGDNWTNKNGWGQNKDICSWYGVTCEAGKVTYLNLGENNLVGIIPAAIGKLTNLNGLYLQKNQLSGNIPNEISQLTNLKYLTLWQNQLTGNIIFDLFVNIEILDLTDNQLTGNLNNIGKLRNLTNIGLGGNQLAGGIPNEIGNLTKLKFLGLWGNQLTGSIPTEIGKLTNLKQLGLSQNQLTGSIPRKIGNLTELDMLNLFGNQLTGSIPTEIGNLTELKWLYLHNNQLTGSIPTQIGNFTKLDILSLSSNQLTGSIPTEIGNLTELDTLDLSSNQLTGSIPTEIGNLTELKWLYLHNNQLTGSIPTQIGNFTKLDILSLSSNQLTGGIPTEIGRLTSLRNLFLSENQLTGSIPISLKNLEKLVAVHLHDNHLCTNDVEVQAFLDNKIGQNEFNWKYRQINTPCDPRYTTLQNTVNIGYEHTLKENTPLTLTVELKDNLATFTVKKTNGTAFEQNGTMYLKVGSFEKYGAERTKKTVKKGDTKIVFDTVDNDKYPNYPKMYFARFESSDTSYHAYVGPVIINKRPADGPVASAFNGNIVSYLNGNSLIFQYVDTENDYQGSYSWYINDDLTTVKSWDEALVVPLPKLGDPNPINHVMLQSSTGEFLYSYPQSKDSYQIASFKNYILNISKGKTDKVLAVAVGNQFFEITTDPNKRFDVLNPQKLTPTHSTSLSLPLGDLSQYGLTGDTPISIYEGVASNNYQPADIEGTNLYVRQKALINIDPLVDLLSGTMKTSSTRASVDANDFIQRMKNIAGELDSTVKTLEKNPLLPDGFKPSEVKSKSVELALELLAMNVGMQHTKKFLDNIGKKVNGVIDGVDAVIYLNVLASKLEEAEREGTPEGIRNLYVLTYLFENTPLKKFLSFHGLIAPITKEIEKIESNLNRRNCGFQAGPVNLSVYQDNHWWFDTTMSDVKTVRLRPIKLMYGDGVTTTAQNFTLEARSKHAVELTQSNGVWQHRESKTATNGEIDFASSPLYCGTWMVEAIDVNGRSYYGRITIRSNGSEPSAITVYEKAD